MDSYVFNCNFVWVEWTSSTHYLNNDLPAVIPLCYDSVLLGCMPNARERWVCLG